MEMKTKFWLEYLKEIGHLRGVDANLNGFK